ncbi:MAG TPA: tetratricopeptide repeat protein [Candidatus Solibacter sp.]|nr:tetratricopeptide repeat protein [Candidatus Solibacter sp.]
MRRPLRALCCLGLFNYLAVAEAQADEGAFHRYIEQTRAFRLKGEFAEAEKFGRDANLATSWNNLGALYCDAGRYAEAEKLLRRALDLWDKVINSVHPEVPQGLNNLAVLYLRTGRVKEAEPLLVRVLEIREETLPPDHKDIAPNCISSRVAMTMRSRCVGVP